MIPTQIYRRKLHVAPIRMSFITTNAASIIQVLPSNRRAGRPSPPALSPERPLSSHLPPSRPSPCGYLTAVGTKCSTHGPTIRVTSVSGGRHLKQRASCRHFRPSVVLGRSGRARTRRRPPRRTTRPCWHFRSRFKRRPCRRRPCKKRFVARAARM